MVSEIAPYEWREAEQAFRRATTSKTQSIRAGGYQWLAHLAWKVRGDTAEASRYVDSALAEARDASTPLTAWFPAV